VKLENDGLISDTVAVCCARTVGSGSRESIHCIASHIAHLMSFSRLASVELQLIMHVCDRFSLLKLTRCSKLTLAAASTDFAWKFARVVVPFCFKIAPPRADRSGWFGCFRAERAPRIRLADQIRSCILCHANISIRWTYDSNGGRQDSDMTFAEMNELLAVPRLVSLDCRGRMFFSLAMLQLLRSPAIANLDKLQPKIARKRWLSDALKLTSLSFFVPSALPLVPYLSRLPSLTSVSVTDSSQQRADVDLTGIGACSSLRSLQLYNIREENLTALLTSPTLSTVHSLTLSDIILDFGADMTEVRFLVQWNVIFTLLRRLMSLTLEAFCGVNFLIKVVTESSVPLRKLVVRSRQIDHYGLALAASQMVTSTSISALLKSHPSLRFIVLQLPSLASYQGFYRHEVAASDWKKADVRYQSIAALAPHRVKVQRNVALPKFSPLNWR
jgi:hypothetical protein